jgi:hypothetical protein
LTVPRDQRTFEYLKPDFRVAAGSPVSKPEGVFPRIELPALVET